MEDKKKILIVDDNQAIHEDLAHILGLNSQTAIDDETVSLENELFGSEEKVNQNANIYVQEYVFDDAYQGEEAIEMVEKAEIEGKPYSLVFMDVRMPPGMDGIQTISKIWEKYPHVEMVICTAYTDYSWDQIVNALGSMENLLFMKKPFDSVVVRQTVLSATKKWDKVRKSEIQINELEKEVKKRTEELNQMMVYLRDLKESAYKKIISKNKFITNMSFEIRTPLNGILGMTDMLLDTELDEDQKSYATTIKTSGDSMLNAIKNILDYPMNESDHTDFEDIEFIVRNIVESVADMMILGAYEKGIEIAAMIYAGVPEIIKGEPLGLRQILLSLTDNAIKYSEKGEILLTVKVASKSEPINEKNSNKQKTVLLFEVSDTGVGMTVEKQKKLNLYLSGNDTNEHIDQTEIGMGLTVCRKLAEEINGKIELESEKGKGTKFSFLKEYEVSKMPDTRHFNGSSTVSGLNCIIVGDNSTSRKVLSLYINQWGAICIESKNREDMIEKLNTDSDSDQIDVIIIEYKDDDLRKYKETAQDIRKQDQYSSAKLIGIMNAPRRGDAQKMKNYGFSGYLTKPIKHSHLYNTLRMLKAGNNNEFDQDKIITKHLIEEISPERLYVLLVEDNSLNQKVMTMMLNRFKIRVDLAENGKEAIDAVNKNRYDMIFMDCKLPIMDGYETTMKIRENEKSANNKTREKKRIPIIAVTADALEKNREKCLLSGMDEFISKPIKSENLEIVLKKYFDKEKQMSSTI